MTITRKGFIASLLGGIAAFFGVKAQAHVVGANGPQIFMELSDPPTPEECKLLNKLNVMTPHERALYMQHMLPSEGPGKALRLSSDGAPEWFDPPKSDD